MYCNCLLHIVIFNILKNAAQLTSELANGKQINTNIVDESYKTLMFDSETIKTINIEEIETLCLKVETIVFKNTLINRIPEELFERTFALKNIFFVNNVNLKSLPQSFYLLKHLNVLVVDNDILMRLPANFKSLKKLKMSMYNEKLIEKLLTDAKQFKNLTHLNIQSSSLKKIPNGLYKLTQIEILSLSNNELDEIPTELLKLRKLKHLDVSRNHIRNLSNVFVALAKTLLSINISYNFILCFSGIDFNEIKTDTIKSYLFSFLKSTQLKETYTLKTLIISSNTFLPQTNVLDKLVIFTNLEKIALCNCNLSEVPNFIYGLKKLKHLDLRSNSIVDIPEKLAEQSIETLKLCKNNLLSIPSNIALIKTLKNLHLSGNNLTAIPEDFARVEKDQQLVKQFQNLEELDLSYNYLMKLPNNISDLVSLRALNLSYNLLYDFPTTFLDLSCLETLYIVQAMFENPKNFLHQMPSLKKVVFIKRIEEENIN